MQTLSPPRNGAAVIPLHSVQTASCSSGGCGQSSPSSVMVHDDDAPCAGTVAMMVTRRCNMSCGHCSVESSPHIKVEPTREELLERVRDAAQSGVKGILITGGEAMLRAPLVLEILRECKVLCVGTAMTSNGFWGRDARKAETTLQELIDAGLGQLTISFDRYHAEFQGPQAVENIIRAGQKRNFTVRVSVTRALDDTELNEITAPFDALPGVQLRFYDVQPIGRARNLEGALRAETGGFCNACGTPALTDDGRMTTCNGPSYFSPTYSPLIIGDLKEESMGTLLERHASDPILETIRTFGPEYLLKELSSLPGFEDFARPSYGGMCELCLHVNSNEKAVNALYTHLSQPRLVATRMAARYVIEGERCMTWNIDAVNGLAAYRVFLRAALSPASEWEVDAKAILGRADFDWHHQEFHLSQCGLAGPLQNALATPQMKRWAPQFFVEKLRSQARIDTLRSLVQREAMRRLSDVLGEFGARGVLLKGSGMAALEMEAPPHQISRASCDVDVHIAPKVAAKVRARLLELGWKPDAPEGEAEQNDGEHHHQLGGLRFEGVLVEIHQTLLPAYCALPERDMVAHAVPLQDPTLANLSVLSPEGMMLHSVMHGTKHLFSHYLKTAWDIEWITRRFSDLDWKLLGQWANASGMQRGFWVPITLLSQEFGLSVPAEFLKSAPRDLRARRLENFARNYLLRSVRFDFDNNPWIRRCVHLWFCDSTFHRARTLRGFVFGRSSREFRQRRGKEKSELRFLAPKKMRQVWQSWRKLA